MKLLSVFFAISIFLSSLGQDSCSAVIDWHFEDAVQIFDKPGGTIIDQIQNDPLNEDFLHLTILDQTNNHFLVSIWLSINKKIKIGWIKKEEYIGAYHRSETHPMNLVLYETKEKSERHRILVKDWNPKLLTIEACANEWVLVSVIFHGQKYKGWIPANMLCANSYSTCS